MLHAPNTVRDRFPQGKTQYLHRNLEGDELCLMLWIKQFLLIHAGTEELNLVED